MKCPVCEIVLEKNKFTCSMECAGKLAYSKRFANKLRESFNNREKQQVREYLWKLIKNQILSVKNQNHTVSILDFWGGGLFADYILDQMLTVNNQGTFILYEIDQDKKLFPALRDYANRKNQSYAVKNHLTDVKPFCGSLADFVHEIDVDNQKRINFIWLDYCGTLMNLREDLKHVKKIMNNNSILAITIFRQRDNAIDGKNRHKFIDTMLSEYLPLHKRAKSITYGEKGAMEVYIYKMSNKLKKFKWFRKEANETINNGAVSFRFA